MLHVGLGLYGLHYADVIGNYDLGLGLGLPMLGAPSCI